MTPNGVGEGWRIEDVGVGGASYCRYSLPHRTTTLHRRGHKVKSTGQGRAAVYVATARYLDPASEAAWTSGQEQTPREHQLDDVIHDHFRLVPVPRA